MTQGHRWAVVLAGGDGRRLRRLSRALAGDDRPKQFCRVFGGRTLLGDTLARLSATVAPRATLVVVQRAHAPYYTPELRDLASWQIVEQPANRGTGAAVALALSRIAALDSDATVGFFPADHHFANEPAFERAVGRAYTAARHTDRVVLVGAEPTGPETDYGWIEPGAPLLPLCRPPSHDMVRTVRAFSEKPGPEDARRLYADGSLWNTFIVIGTRAAFDRLLGGTVPEAWARFARLREAVPPGQAEAVVTAIYDTLPAFDLSRDVLQRVPDALAVVPSPGAGWTDLGRPSRVMDVLSRVHHPSHAASPVAV